MGNVHDMSGYTRQDMIVEFTELAKRGLQTPQPLWMHKDKLPEWAARKVADWEAYRFSTDGRDPADRRRQMDLALTERKPAPKPKKDATQAAKAGPGAEAPQKAGGASEE